MKFFGSLAAVIAGLSYVVDARIVDFSVPTSSIAPGATFEVTFRTESYSSDNSQYYALFGLWPTTLELPPLTLGQTLSGYDIYENGHSSTGGGSFEVELTLPSNTAAGDYTVTSIVFGTVSSDSRSSGVHSLARLLKDST